MWMGCNKQFQGTVLGISIRVHALMINLPKKKSVDKLISKLIGLIKNFFQIQVPFIFQGFFWSGASQVTVWKWNHSSGVKHRIWWFIGAISVTSESTTWSQTANVKNLRPRHFWDAFSSISYQPSQDEWSLMRRTGGGNFRQWSWMGKDTGGSYGLYVL